MSRREVTAHGSLRPKRTTERRHQNLSKQMAHLSYVMVYVMLCLPGYVLPMPLAMLSLGGQEQRISLRSFPQSVLWLPLVFTTASKSLFQGNDSWLGPWRRLTQPPKIGTFSDLRNLRNHPNQEQRKRCNN